MRVIEYDRKAVVAYARRWAFARNPQYYNFDRLGGDCTNFASQCLFAGCGVMNFTPTFGWFYLDLQNRAPAWTGVEYFYQFLMNHQCILALCNDLLQGVVLHTQQYLQMLRK